MSLDHIHPRHLVKILSKTILLLKLTIEDSITYAGYSILRTSKCQNSFNSYNVMLFLVLSTIFLLIFRSDILNVR